ncbi:MAG: Ldh family oxidoreductase [Bacillota bacterium]
MKSNNLFSVPELIDFSEKLLINSGIKKEDAQIVVKVLIQADLEGVGSHGLTRLPVYLERLEKGLINKEPVIKTVFNFPALAIVDADNGLGHVAAYEAMKTVIKKAKEFGIAAVGVKNSNHFSAASYYANMALEENLVGIVIANGPPAIPPWGGREAYFGTNPLAISIPGGSDFGPISIDMATSIVARGKIIKAAQEGEPIGPDWALDSEGKPTADAKEALKGCILPMGAHKGAALAMAIEMLSGLLTGAGYGKGVIWQYSDSLDPSNVGHLMIAINPQGFLDLEEIRSRMDAMIGEMKSLPKAYGYDEIRMPGERERELAKTNYARGISLGKELLEKFEQLSVKFSVPLPESII